MGKPSSFLTAKSAPWIGVAAFVYAGVIFNLLPAGVVVINDDFGYLKSVVLTLQHGRPWTDDWLEPWSAALSAGVGLLYWITGKFYLSAYGLVAVLAGVSFWTAARILLRRGLSIGATVCVATLVLTFPTVIWKSLEFTGMVVYLPCLLLALWAAETRRWWLFALAWLLAVTTRQSAIAWLALPALTAAKNIWKREARQTWLSPLLIVVGGGLFFRVFGLWMNKTHSQSVLTDHLLARADLRTALGTFGIGVIVFLAAMGVGAAISQLRRPFAPATWLARGWPGVLGVLIVTLALLVLDERKLVQVEHTSFDGSWGSFHLKILVALSAVGWLAGGFTLSIEKAVCALACLAPTCLRSELWDYYFLDVAVFGLFGVNCETSGIGTGIPSARKWSLVVWALLAMLGVRQVWTTLQFKFSLDRAFAQCVLAERSIRSGLLSPTAIGFAPFGYRGWYLHEYHITHEGKSDATLANLHRYVNWGATGIDIRYRGWIRRLPGFEDGPGVDPRTVIATQSKRFAWFFRADYTLFKQTTDRGAETSVNEKEFFPWPFPLNDEEWRRLIAAPPVRTLTGAQIDYDAVPPHHRRLFRTMQPQPVRFYSTFGPELWNEDQPGAELFRADALTRLWFRLPSGSHRLRTALELVPGAYEGLALHEASDGVELVASAVGADGEKKVLHRRAFNPRDNPGDRGPQEIDWELAIAPGVVELELEINAGPQNNNTRDWTLLHAIVIEQTTSRKQ